MAREIETAGRLATLEVRQTVAEDQISQHSEHLQALDLALTSLVSEVKQIRNALYAMAAALAANVPALKELLGQIKSLLVQ